MRWVTFQFVDTFFGFLAPLWVFHLGKDNLHGERARLPPRAVLRQKVRAVPDDEGDRLQDHRSDGRPREEGGAQGARRHPGPLPLSTRFKVLYYSDYQRRRLRYGFQGVGKSCCSLPMISKIIRWLDKFQITFHGVNHGSAENKTSKLTCYGTILRLWVHRGTAVIYLIIYYRDCGLCLTPPALINKDKKLCLFT